MSQLSKRERPAARPQGRNGKNRFDRALIEAMQRKRKVDIFIAADLPWINDDGFATVTILEVDTFAIRVRNEAGKESWLGKGYIVEARINQ